MKRSLREPSESKKRKTGAEDVVECDLKNCDLGVVSRVSVTGLTDAKLRAYLRPLSHVPDFDGDSWPHHDDVVDEDGTLAFGHLEWDAMDDEEATRRMYEGLGLLYTHGRPKTLEYMRIPPFAVATVAGAAKLGSLLRDKFPNVSRLFLDTSAGARLTDAAAEALVAPLATVKELQITNVVVGNIACEDTGPTPLGVVKARANELERLDLVGNAKDLSELLRTTHFPVLEDVGLGVYDDAGEAALSMALLRLLKKAAPEFDQLRMLRTCEDNPSAALWPF